MTAERPDRERRLTHSQSTCSSAVVVQEGEGEGEWGMVTEELVEVAAVSQRQREVVAEMLAAEWPGGGCMQARLSALCRLEQQSRGGKVGGGYCLLSEEEVLGYARVEPSAESSTGVDSFGGGLVGIVTSVIIAPTWRGQGVGERLMTLLECTCKEIGFHFLYLWADECLANSFYKKKCDFIMSKQETALVSALDTLGETSVISLENMLRRQMISRLDSSQDQASNHPNNMESSSMNDKMVWLSKRIRYEEHPLNHYCCDSESDEVDDEKKQTTKLEFVLGSWRDALRQSIWFSVVSRQQWWQFANRDEVQPPESSTYSNGQTSLCYNFAVISRVKYLPWAQQIGPTCGIQAVRMVSRAILGELLDSNNAPYFEEYILQISCGEPVVHLNSINSSSKQKFSHAEVPQNDFSLLSWAINEGYSCQGEVFDIENLALILKKQLSVDVEAINQSEKRFRVSVRNFSDLGWRGVLDFFMTEGGYIILPYDRNRKEHSNPTCHSGLCAHYAIICGAIYPQTLKHFSTDDNCNLGNVFDNEKIALIALQSMSPAPVVAPFVEWEASNLQLFSKHGSHSEKDLHASAATHEKFLETTRGWKIPECGSNLGGNCLMVRLANLN